MIRTYPRYAFEFVFGHTGLHDLVAIADRGPIRIISKGTTNVTINVANEDAERVDGMISRAVTILKNTVKTDYGYIPASGTHAGLDPGGYGFFVEGLQQAQSSVENERRPLIIVNTDNEEQTMAAGDTHVMDVPTQLIPSLNSTNELGDQTDIYDQYGDVCGFIQIVYPGGTTGISYDARHQRFWEFQVVRWNAPADKRKAHVEQVQVAGEMMWQAEWQFDRYQTTERRTNPCNSRENAIRELAFRAGILEQDVEIGDEHPAVAVVPDEPVVVNNNPPPTVAKETAESIKYHEPRRARSIEI